jgi:hypothetical protein
MNTKQEIPLLLTACSEFSASRLIVLGPYVCTIILLRLSGRIKRGKAGFRCQGPVGMGMRIIALSLLGERVARDGVPASRRGTGLRPPKGYGRSERTARYGPQAGEGVPRLCQSPNPSLTGVKDVPAHGHALLQPT